MNELLKPYVALVDFLADYLGSNTEVLLHDLTNLEHSIVKIRNGHISGRKEGDPCTDFALRIVQKPPENKQYRTNYKSFHKNGAPMKSGTFFIRNANHEIIGLLCINIESTQYVQMKAFLDSFFGGGPLDTQETPENGNGETLGKSIGKDAEENKLTWVAIRGIEGTREDAAAEIALAVDAANRLNGDVNFLQTLAQSTLNRVQ